MDAQPNDRSAAGGRELLCLSPFLPRQGGFVVPLETHGLEVRSCTRITTRLGEYLHVRVLPCRSDTEAGS